MIRGARKDNRNQKIFTQLLNFERTLNSCMCINTYTQNINHSSGHKVSSFCPLLLFSIIFFFSSNVFPPSFPCFLPLTFPPFLSRIHLINSSIHSHLLKQTLFCTLGTQLSTRKRRSLCLHGVYIQRRRHRNKILKNRDGG